MAKHNNPNILSFDADVIVFHEREGELSAQQPLRPSKQARIATLSKSSKVRR